jgi:hypothetical protein
VTGSEIDSGSKAFDQAEFFRGHQAFDVEQDRHASFDGADAKQEIVLQARVSTVVSWIAMALNSKRRTGETCPLKCTISVHRMNANRKYSYI